jgi:hypothetical protein
VPPQPENVSELPLPGSKKYDVSLAFSGDAARGMSELMTSLGAENANEVAKRAIALLLSAQGKEILLRDRNGKVEAVDV